MSLSNPAGRADFAPADHGFISWSYDPSFAGSALIMQTAGRLNTVRLKLAQPALVTSIRAIMSTAGATLTAGQNFAMLFDESGNRVGVTADMAALWAGATGELDMPLTAPVQVSGPFCHVGFYANGSTLPTFRVANNTSAIHGNAGLATALSRYGLSTAGLTSTPPATIGTVNGNNFPWWIGIR